MVENKINYLRKQNLDFYFTHKIPSHFRRCSAASPMRFSPEKVAFQHAASPVSLRFPIHRELPTSCSLLRCEEAPQS